MKKRFDFQKLTKHNNNQKGFENDKKNTKNLQNFHLN